MEGGAAIANLPPALCNFGGITLHGAFAKLHLQPSDRVTWLDGRGRISHSPGITSRHGPFAHFLEPFVFCAVRYVHAAYPDAMVTPRKSA
jgi:hypothetical protein